MKRRKIKIFKEYKSLELQHTPKVRELVKSCMQGCFSLYNRAGEDMALDIWSSILAKQFFNQMLEYDYFDSTDYSDIHCIAFDFLSLYLYTVKLKLDKKSGFFVDEYNFLSNLSSYISKHIKYF